MPNRPKCSKASLPSPLPLNFQVSLPHDSINLDSLPVCIPLHFPFKILSWITLYDLKHLLLFGPFGPIRSTMYTLVLFGQVRSTLVLFGPFCLLWSYFYQFQSYLVYIGPIPSILSTLVLFGPLQFFLVHIGPIQSIKSTLVHFGPIPIF